MSTANSAPLSPDPLDKRRIVTSGPHVRRILLVAALVIGLGLAGYMLGRSQGPASPSRLPIQLDGQHSATALPSYEDMAPKPQPTPPTPRFETPRASSAPPPKPQARRPAKEDELRKKAMEAGVGGWGRKEADRTATADSTGRSQFASANSECFVPPGTPIAAQTINRIVTEHGGIVAAQVTRDVWDAGFSCLAVPAGSTITMDIGNHVAKGQRRIEITRPVITRPWPRNDAVPLAAMGADASGASGLAGTIEVPWFETGLLIAASTAVDVGVAALTGGSSLIGGILGHSMDRPLDKAAKDLLDQAPVITLEAGEPMLLLLRGGLLANDFRN